MAKRDRCATCGKVIPPLGWHLVYDSQLGRAVKVCADDRSCQKPYVRKVTSIEPAKNAARPYKVNQA